MNVEAIGEIYRVCFEKRVKTWRDSSRTAAPTMSPSEHTDVTIGNDPTAATVTVRPHTRVTEEPARAAGHIVRSLHFVRSARVVYRGKGFALGAARRR